MRAPATINAMSSSTQRPLVCVDSDTHLMMMHKLNHKSRTCYMWLDSPSTIHATAAHDASWTKVKICLVDGRPVTTTGVHVLTGPSSDSDDESGSVYASASQSSDEDEAPE